MKKQIFQSQIPIRFQKKTPTPPHKDPFYSIKTITNLMTYETKYIQQTIVKLAVNMTNALKVELGKYSNHATH